MYIVETRKKGNNKVYTQVLLRESYRRGKEVKSRVISNLTSISRRNPYQIEVFKCFLKGELPKIAADEIKQGLPIGAIYAFKEIADRLHITSSLGKRNPFTPLALLLVFSRIIIQGSRLSAFRLTESSEIKSILGIDPEKLKIKRLYETLGYLAENQRKIEKRLLSYRKKQKPKLFLYDVTSSYLEGEYNELAQYGYNRDQKKGKKQLVIGLLTDEDGFPVSSEVFEGNTSDPETVFSQIEKLAYEFKVKEVTLVGDRGMLKSIQIENLKKANFHYITAITKPQVRALLEQGIIQLDLFGEEIAEISDDGVRYILRRNPFRAKEVKENRKERLEKFKEKVSRENLYLKEHLRAKSTKALSRLEKLTEKLKVAKYFILELKEREIVFGELTEVIEKEGELDGCYVIKTDLTKEVADKKNVDYKIELTPYCHIELTPLKRYNLLQKRKEEKGDDKHV